MLCETRQEQERAAVLVDRDGNQRREGRSIAEHARSLHRRQGTESDARCQLATVGSG
jgi:hypothetical protein